ncbi:MAG: hypothetical protein ACK417_09520 [Bacteroidia bacterium]
MMIGGGTIAAMIASVEQNGGMLRSAHRKSLNKEALVRGLGQEGRSIQGPGFKSESARRDFLEKLAMEKRREDRQLKMILLFSLLVLFAILAWVIG